MAQGNLEPNGSHIEPFYYFDDVVAYGERTTMPVLQQRWACGASGWGRCTASDHRPPKAQPRNPCSLIPLPSLKHSSRDPGAGCSCDTLTHYVHVRVG